MLVLTRKYQEKIRIGNNITITVLRTKGKAVRLGIEAPADVPVIRGELSFDESSEAGVTVDSTETPESANEPLKRERRRPVTPTAWGTGSHPDGAKRNVHSDVQLRRVPRQQVSEILPDLVSGKAPLRAAMTRRSATR